MNNEFDNLVTVHKQYLKKFLQNILEKFEEVFDDENPQDAINVLRDTINAQLDDNNKLEAKKCRYKYKKGKKQCDVILKSGEFYCKNHRGKGCIHVLTNGPRIHQRCDQSIIGTNIYCSLHAPKHENPIDEFKNVAVLNRFGQMEHLDTQLIFEGKAVCGKRGPRGSVIPLDDDDFEAVRKHKFMVVDSLVFLMEDYMKRYKNKKPQIQPAPVSPTKKAPKVKKSPLTKKIPIRKVEKWNFLKDR